MKNEFEQEVLETFNADVPDPISKIKSDPSFRVPPKPTGFNVFEFFKNKKVIGALSAIIFSLIIVASISRVAAPVVASTVTIDINPSLVITLDSNDRVITVTGLNDDAEAILDSEKSYKGMSIEEFVDVLIVLLDDSDYIVNNTDDYNIVLINVDSENESKTSVIQERFSTKINQNMRNLNASCFVLNSDDIDLTNDDREFVKSQFQSSNQTQARWVLIYRLSNIQDEHTVDELKDMTLVELYNIYIMYEDIDNLPNYDNMPGIRNRFNQK